MLSVVCDTTPHVMPNLDAHEYQLSCLTRHQKQARARWLFCHDAVLTADVENII